MSISSQACTPILLGLGVYTKYFTPSGVVNHIETFGNIISFPGFLFCFGYANQSAYFNRGFAHSYGRMIRTAVKILVAFYISGIFFRIFDSQVPVAWQPIRSILLLSDIPGWSEFLAGFFALTVVAIVFFYPLLWLLEKKWVFWLVFFTLLATPLFPYGEVTSTQIGLFVGTTKFSCFPVLQYLPYYLLGMYMNRYKVVFDYRLMIGAFVGSLVFFAYVFRTGHLPSRFPPSLPWIVSSMFLEYIYYLISGWLAKMQLSLRFFSAMGKNVLSYLLIGNIILFTLKNVAGGYLYLDTTQCFYLAVILMLFAAYMVHLAAMNRQTSYDQS